MSKRENKLIGIVLISIMVILISCAHGQVKQTPQQLYDEAISFWYNSEQNFRLIYESSTKAEQAKMIPYAKALLEAKKALDLWKLNLDGGQATADNIRQWKNLKNKLIIMALNKYQGKED